MLFYRYVTITVMMYFTVTIPVHVFGEKGAVCHIPQYLMYMIQTEVHYNHHSLFKTSRHQMLQNCLLSVTNNNVVPLYPVDVVQSASLYTNSITHSTKPAFPILNRPCLGQQYSNAHIYTEIHYTISCNI